MFKTCVSWVCFMCFMCVAFILPYTPKKTKKNKKCGNMLCDVFDSAELNLTATYFKYYALGGSAFGWNDVGSPDMCVYAQGTYCYTPLLTDGAIAFEHGCCLPGVCKGKISGKKKLFVVCVWLYCIIFFCVCLFFICE